MYIKILDTNKFLDVSDNIYKTFFNRDIVKQVFFSYKSNLRKNNKLNKNRSKVAGSGKKPWKQKGTGNARAGCLRSPLWRSGGVTFGNQIKKYKKKINKKMYKVACKSILSKFLYNNKLLLFKNFKIDKISTNNLYKILYKLVKTNKVLIILYNKDIILEKSINNIYFAKLEYIINLNLIKIIEFKYLITNINVIKYIEKILC